MQQDLLTLMTKLGAAYESFNASKLITDGTSNEFDEQIFALCCQLKTAGLHMEHTNKADLNRLFITLRRACCNDLPSMALSDACRLCVMELIELRAMNWRPKLAHTQYYLSHLASKYKYCYRENNNDEKNFDEVKQHLSEKPDMNDKIPVIMETQLQKSRIELNNKQNSNNQDDFANNHEMIQKNSNQNNVLSLTLSYGLPIPSTSMGPLYVPPPQPHIGTTRGTLSNGAPGGFFIIPANDTWPVPPIISTASYLPSTGVQLVASNKLLVNGQRANTMMNVASKLAKTWQFREEMIIRNSDSGKIMGVKGRRVALVEELSDTIISFQKVDAKCRDRVLTITGSSLAAIIEARRLIDETIRCNASPPPRVKSDKIETKSSATNFSNKKSDIFFEKNGLTTENVENKSNKSPSGIFIETSPNATLNLCCEDSKMLENAHIALNEYLKKEQIKRYQKLDGTEINNEK